MRETTCPCCSKTIVAASIEVRWDTTPYNRPSKTWMSYEHEDHSRCRRDPATRAGINDLLAELRRLPARARPSLVKSEDQER